MKGLLCVCMGKKKGGGFTINSRLLNLKAYIFLTKCFICIFVHVWMFNRRHWLKCGVRFSCTCCATTANPVWSFHSSQNLTQVRSRQARIQQLDRLLLWTRWFRWGGIASVSAATMAVWLVHQSPPAAHRAALWLAFGLLPDSVWN